MIILMGLAGIFLAILTTVIVNIVGLSMLWGVPAAYEEGGPATLVNIAGAICGFVVMALWVTKVM